MRFFVEKRLGLGLGLGLGLEPDLVSSSLQYSPQNNNWCLRLVLKRLTDVLEKRQCYVIMMG